MAAADKIRKHLTCCICMELYRGPKTLPCMHSFCEGCLSGHICSNRRIANGFLCPLCKAFTLSPVPDAHRHHWANQFTTDFKLTNMLQEVDELEEQSCMAKTRSMLMRTRGRLLVDKRSLTQTAEETKTVLNSLQQDQEVILGQLADAFLSARQKLLSKEEELKKRLKEMYAEQKRGVSESWNKLQWLLNQADDLIADVERIVTPSTTTDTHVDVQTFHSKHTQFIAKFTGLDVPEVNFDITFHLRKNDLAKIDSVTVCEIDQNARLPGGPAPCSLLERASISSTLLLMDGNGTSMKTTVSPPGTQGLSRRPLAQLVTTMTPENDSICADFQDIAVLHVNDVQIVVLTDDKYNVTAMYTDKNSVEYKTLKVAGHPSRICKLDSTRVAVSVNNPQRVIIIRVYPNLQKMAVLKTWQTNHDKNTSFGVTALNPYTLAVARKNKIKIVTTDNCDLVDFKLKTDWNVEPWYMATHPKGYIIVSDRAGEMVYCTTQTGQILWQWKAPVVPAGVACDKDGRIYVALPDKLKIQSLNENGQAIGDAVNSNSGLMSAYGIDVDEYGQMYVLIQTKSHNIQLFSKITSSVERSKSLSVLY